MEDGKYSSLGVGPLFIEMIGWNFAGIFESFMLNLVGKHNFFLHT